MARTLATAGERPGERMAPVPNPPVPQHCPSPRELDDLELLTTGALAPIASFNQPGSPITLDLPAAVAEQATAAGAVELVDPEGLPLAVVSVPGGAVEPLTHAQFGPFRSHYLTPAQSREAYAGRTYVPVTDALTTAQLDELRGSGPLVLLALVGHGTPDLSPVALLRATLAAAGHLPDAAVVAVPLAAHGDAEVDHALGLQVATNYAGPDPVIALPSPSEVEVRGAPATSLETPERDLSAYPADIAEIVDFDQPPADRQGLVLFFTGLSGSGKSTLARALMDRLLEHGVRTVTTLDGDVVRRHLSAGLTFSKEDRETNIRRIGWVAAEISRHGGVAVCSPIAPFDETRQQVRAMVDQAGGAFFLVHVATPLEECERRDRKGLYAKARRGEIPEFTGISSPYEEPEDADVRVDTTGRTIEDALDDVLVALRDEGYLDLTHEEPTTAAPEGAQGGAHTPGVEVRGAPATSLETPVFGGRACRDPPPHPLRLHRQHLPLPVDGAGLPAPGRRRGRHRVRQRRHPRLPRPGDGPDHGRDAGAPGHLRRRVPQPAADRRDGRAGRPGPHRRERAPLLHPRRPPGRLPQGVHARPVRRGGPDGARRALRPRPARLDRPAPRDRGPGAGRPGPVRPGHHGGRGERRTSAAAAARRFNCIS